MSIYRVIVSFFLPNQMQFMAERGVLAMTPGQALTDVLNHLEIDLTRIKSFKCWVEKPDSLHAFNDDAKSMACINTPRTVKDAWTGRYGD